MGLDDTVLVASTKHHVDRSFEFIFDAPLINVKFENVVDGRNRFEGNDTTPLLDFVLKWIEARLVR
jgi:hypothetical protein